MPSSRLKTVVFLLPGEIFSNNFLRSWTTTLLKLPEYRIKPQIRWTIGSNVYKVRNDILMGGKTQGKNQKPFHGKLNYDYLMWIDSDQVWDPAQFKRLFDTMEGSSNLHILSGVYLRNDKTNYTAVVGKNHPDFPPDKIGFLQPADLRRKKKLIQVEFTGMGFMMVRYGVMEAIDYPWFAPLAYTFDNDRVVGFTNEDAAFCRRASEKGFYTYIDPTLVIGHEKPTILR